jgi:hypothetical protein
VDGNVNVKYILSPFGNPRVGRWRLEELTIWELKP